MESTAQALASSRGAHRAEPPRLAPDEAVRRCILSQPRNFQSGADVLRHILLSDSTGWRWEAGQPITDDPLEPWSPTTMEGFYGPLSGSATLRELLRNALAPSMERSQGECALVVATVDDRLAVEPLVGSVDAPADCLWASMPDEVSPAWALAISQFLGDATVLLAD